MSGFNREFFNQVENLSAAGAKRALAAAEAYAEKCGWKVAIAVVDSGGHLLAFQRMQGCGSASADISIGKAVSAARFGKYTGKLEGAINSAGEGQGCMPGSGRTALSTAGFTMMQGGVPIILANGHVAGAIGVSGVESHNDEDVAEHGKLYCFLPNLYM